MTSLNALWTFLSNYSYLFGAILIGLGFFINFFGRKLFKPVIFLLGMLAFVAVSLLFFYSIFFNQNTKSYVGWIVLGCSGAVGILVGILLAKLSKVGVAVLAGWGGICLFLIVWSAFLYTVHS